MLDTTWNPSQTLNQRICDSDRRTIIKLNCTDTTKNKSQDETYRADIVIATEVKLKYCNNETATHMHACARIIFDESNQPADSLCDLAVNTKLTFMKHMDGNAFDLQELNHRYSDIWTINCINNASISWHMGVTDNISDPRKRFIYSAEPRVAAVHRHQQCRDTIWQNII